MTFMENRTFFEGRYVIKTPIKTTTIFKRDMFQCLLPPFSNVNDNSADRLHTKVGSILQYTRVHSK